MPRIARIVAIDYPHHIVQRGNNREKVFVTEKDFKKYLSLLEKYSVEKNSVILAYCLMPNHVHLLIKPLGEDSLYKMMQGVTLCYTQYFNRKNNRTGRLWECRYHSTIIDRESYLWTVCRYIEKNPVRAGIVKKAEDYPYSSAKSHILGERNVLLSERLFDRDEITSYRSFIEGDEDKDSLNSIRSQTRLGKPLGDKGFLAILSKKLGCHLTFRPKGRPKMGCVPIKYFKDKKITVMGLGLFGGGVGAVKYLVSHGADVTVTDLKSAEELSASLKLLDDLPVKLRLGKHYEEDFVNVDMLVVSPAVPNDSRFLQLAFENNVRIDSELNIFFRLCPAPVVGITGSNGKSTTTSLLGKMLKDAGIKTWVGGNIGISLLENLEEIKPGDVVVLEISSFQLEYLARIEMSPHISIVTNIAPNHLDRHKTMENYIGAKKAIIHYQQEDDYVILNYDDLTLKKWEGESKGRHLWFSATKELENGAFLKNNEIIIKHDSKRTVIPCSTQINIKGIHNWQNIMAASYAATLMHADVESIKNAITGFAGLEHRLEYVHTINEIQYYNDSKATTPEAAIAGIKAFDSPTILIAGGYDKQVSLHQFAQECVKNTKCVILIGETAKTIQKHIQDIKGEKIKPEIYIAASLDGAVKKASEVAKTGDIVLLSPACASFGMFTNYEDRGKKFKAHVSQLNTNEPAHMQTNVT